METITKLKFLKNIIVAIILCPCIVGFLWICWKQSSLYLQGFTSVTTVFSVDKHNFPNVIFCSLKPYKEFFNKSRVAKETYDSITNLVDIKVYIKSNAEIIEIEFIVFPNFLAEPQGNNCIFLTMCENIFFRLKF